MPSKKPSSNRGKKSPAIDSRARFEKLLRHTTAIEHYQLRLFITGTTARSAQAIANIRALCEEFLHGRYDLEVVDIYQQPSHAASEQIIAAPTLVKQLPVPPKRLIGDLSNREKVILGLNLNPGGARAKKGRAATHWTKI